MFEEIIKKSKELKEEEFLDLLDEVTSLLKGESKKKGKLEEKIFQIKENEPFCEGKVIYLPAKGEAVFVGDLHGDFRSLEKILLNFSSDFLIFLGDYVDRGEAQIETLQASILTKIKYPKKVYLLRGNHEDLRVNYYYGFLAELSRRFPKNLSKTLRVYEDFCNTLPYVLATKEGLFTCHGGIPHQGINSLLDFNKDNKEMLEEILWNDPKEEISSFLPNYERGGYFTFGKEAFLRFLSTLGAKVMVRSHQYFSEGYRLFFQDKLLTIFSSRPEGDQPLAERYGGLVEPCYLKINLKEPISRFRKEMIFYPDVKSGQGSPR